MKTLEFRSDTFTKPTPAMRRAMAEAEVGDDQYGEDPTVNKLEKRAAEAVGKEAGLYVASGMLGNLCGVLSQTQRGDEVILGDLAHIYQNEMDAAFVHRMAIPPSVQGVVVTRVDPVGAAFVPAMRRWFVIMEINRQPVRSVADFDRLLATARTGDALAFYGYDPAVGQRMLVLATVDTR